jgi:hypothetical protein
MDERWVKRRVYGAEHDNPDPGPEPGHEYVELCGGPLDGLLVDVTGWSVQERVDGAALMTEIGAFGAGGRAWYRQRRGTAAVWDWDGDSP